MVGRKWGVTATENGVSFGHVKCSKINCEDSFTFLNVLKTIELQLSEVSQSEKDKHYMFSFIWGI